MTVLRRNYPNSHWSNHRASTSPNLKKNWTPSRPASPGTTTSPAKSSRPRSTKSTSRSTTSKRPKTPSSAPTAIYASPTTRLRTSPSKNSPEVTPPRKPNSMSCRATLKHSLPQSNYVKRSLLYAAVINAA